MVIVSPLRIGLWDPFQIAFLWLVNRGDPNHLLAGMILQVAPPQKKKYPSPTPTTVTPPVKRSVEISNLRSLGSR